MCITKYSSPIVNRYQKIAENVIGRQNGFAPIVIGRDLAKEYSAKNIEVYC